MIPTLIPTILTRPTIFVCTNSKSAGALVAGATTGLIVHSHTPAKKHAAVIHGGFITQEQSVLSIAAVAVTAAILANFPMAFSNAGFILQDTEQKLAKMVKIVKEKFVSLHTLLVN
jgi:hypothetical protein